MTEDFRAQGIANLRADMKRRGLTLPALAKLSGVSYGMVRALVYGHRGGKAATCAAIAEALGADPGRYFPRTALELERAEAMWQQVAS